MNPMQTYIGIDLAYSGETGCVIKTTNTIKAITIKHLYNYENQLQTQANTISFCQQIFKTITTPQYEINIVIEISDFHGTVHYEFVAGMLIANLITILEKLSTNINIKRIHSNV